MRFWRLLIVPCMAILIGCGPQAGAPEEVTPTSPEAKTETTPAEPTPDKAAKADEEPAGLTVPSSPPEENTEPKVILPDAAPAKEEGAANEAKNSQLVPAVAAEGWGNLKGRFVYDGVPPTLVKLGDKVNKDLECCGKYLDELVDETLVVSDDGGIANVFVFVRTEGVDIHPDLEKQVQPLRMDHKHCRYEPHAMVVWAGKQNVTFGNVDEISHSVKFDPLNSVANPAINNTLAQNASFDYMFQGDERVPVPVSCAVHQWEAAVILPRTNPYAVVSSEDGTFELANLPVGKLEFQVWQERAGYLAAKPDWRRGRFEIEIKPGENDLGTIKVDPKLLEKK